MTLDFNTIQEQIAQVRGAICEAIRVAVNQEVRVDGAINWADISCTEVLYAVDSNGYSRFIAYVSEASSDAWKFRNFLEDRIKEKTGLQCEVITEW